MPCDGVKPPEFYHIVYSDARYPYGLTRQKVAGGGYDPPTQAASTPRSTN